MNTTLQIRIARSDKNKAQNILEKLGLDLSSGIKMFLRQVIRTKSIPFPVRTVNGFTPEYEAMILRESADAEKNAKRFKTSTEFIKDLMK